MPQQIINLGMWFEQVTRTHGGRTALHFPGGTTYCYHDLNRQANSIAKLLADTGLKQEQILAIVGEKRFEIYASILACLKLGITYCVLDPDSPNIRLEKILQRCKPSALVCSRPIEKEWFVFINRTDWNKHCRLKAVLLEHWI